MNIDKSFVLTAVLAVSNAATAFTREVQYRGLANVVSQKHSPLAQPFKQPLRLRLLAATAAWPLSSSTTVSLAG